MPSDPQACNIFLSDFPMHDMSAELMLLEEQRQVEAGLKEEYKVRGGRAGISSASYWSFTAGLKSPSPWWFALYS